MRDSAISIAVAHALVIKNDDAFVDASLLLPDPVVHDVRCRAPPALRVLSGIAERAVIDSLNAGDVETALQHLNPTNCSTEDNIVAALMVKLERQAHNLELHASSVPSMAFEGGEPAREAELQRVNGRLAEVRAKMDGVRERVKGCDMCCICYEPFSNKSVAPCCSNAFCLSCITRWTHMKGTCPLCKGRLTMGDLLVVKEPQQQQHTNDDEARPSSSSSSNPDEEHDDQQPRPDKDKLENLKRILAKRCSEGAKVLLFSSFDNAFAAIIELLDRLHIRHRFLKGNHYAVAGIERQYREGDLDVLLVNTSNYGSGLNFENTTDVVMLHKFGTEVERQVLGRAQRCGRTTPLNVWYLLNENE
jgi:hypothetical protein